jgi:asparagine synthase (glutamine-hydrolysing)
MKITGTFYGSPLTRNGENDINAGFATGNGYEEFSKNGIKLIFGGLIYNKEELAGGKTEKSIPEILLDNFLKESYKSFRKINGKATIIIRQDDVYTVFRDHWGEGPLFFYTTGFFADTLPGIMQTAGIQPVVNKVSLKSFMLYGFIPAPLTIVEGVSKLPAGYVLIHSAEEQKLINLYDYKEFKSDTLKITMDEAVEEYGRLLQQSIRRRIGGYDKVGALLSGGYDSGGNIAVLREVFDGKIQSYSIGFRDNPFSELPYAKMMADKFGSKHFEYLMDNKDIDNLPEAIKAFGEPFSESGFMLNNAAMRFVKDENLPVIIGGDGNDQMIGTTGKELALHFLIRKKGLGFMQKLFDKIADNPFFDKDNILFKVRFHNKKILNVMRPDNFGFNNHLMNSVFRLGNVAEHPVFAAIPKGYKDFEDFHDLHNFYLDIRHSINEVILNKASRLSAFYGVNLGFTYIDKDIYDFIKKLPLSIRLKGNVDEVAKGKGVTKYIHKVYTKPKLPKEVTERKKQGGFSPLAIFFGDAALRKSVYDYISGSGFAAEFLKPKGLNKFFDSYEKNAIGNGYWFWYKQLKSNQLMNLLIMTLWWDIYINNKDYKTLNEYLKQ